MAGLRVGEAGFYQFQDDDDKGIYGTKQTRLNKEHTYSE